MALRSTKLGIPYIQASQATPEITHNTAVYMLEALTHGAIAIQNAPPGGTPEDGDVYIVGTAGSGAWASRSNHIAVWIDGAWGFIPGFDDDGTLIPIGTDHEGLTLRVQADNLRWVWTGSAWIPLQQEGVYTVGTLPSAVTYPNARARVTDSNATQAAGLGNVVAGGGANYCTVYSDNAGNWRIG